MNHRIPLPAALPYFIAGLVLLACGSEPEFAEPPPPEVTVAPPVEQAVTDYVEMTGTVVSIETVEIRARVEGFLDSVEFSEGDAIAKGDLLYRIDPSEYETRVQQANASLATATASLKLTQTTLERMQKAYASRAVSELEMLESEARRDVSAAELQSAQAELRKARLDLGYTRIRAPLAGRVGRTLVDPGNLVGASEKTLLTTIVRYDPIYAYFNISERELLALTDALGERGAAGTGQRPKFEVPIEVGRSNEPGYPHQGKLQYADLGIDSDTGTFGLRAILRNPDPIKLIPGIFVRGRMAVAERDRALLVSERALGADQTGRYLLVVGDDDVVEYRPVKIGAKVEDLRVIEDGIEAGELIVTNGILRARPGQKVKPKRKGKPAPTPTADSEAPKEADGDEQG